ncbi:MAG: hypothetical protein KKD74_10710 [Bacteroidetes bacterium]|nr:hypothetical protein [Bacteroidota bacterium]
MHRIIKGFDIVASLLLLVAFFLPWVGLGRLASYSGYDLVASAFGFVVKHTEKVMTKEPDTFFVFVVAALPLSALLMLYKRIIKSQSSKRLVAEKLLVIIVFAMVVYGTIDEIKGNLFGELINPWKLIKTAYLINAAVAIYFIFSLFYYIPEAVAPTMAEKAVVLPKAVDAEKPMGLKAETELENRAEKDETRDRKTEAPDVKSDQPKQEDQAMPG